LLVPEISNKEKRGEYDDYFDKAYPNALAILLLHQLNKLDRKNKTRQKAVKIYREALKGKIKDNYHLARFPVLVKDRSKVMEEGRRYGIYFGKWYTQPIAPAALNLEKVGYERGSCPEAEFICDHVINLPTNVSEETAKDIAAIVKSHLLDA
jgi:dTDP-4-amino-4,6-dideoxygalactose transaminase